MSLACACGISGYKLARLGGYQIARGVKIGLGSPVMPTDALIPVSDKMAIANAIKFFKHRDDAREMAGLGNSGRAVGAGSMALTGAEIGSAIFPGIGTIIGAVVGAIVGWVMGKPKPVRATKEQIAQARALLAEYMTLTAEYPDTPVPLEFARLKEIQWAIDAVHGGSVKLKDPRFFAGGFDEFGALCKQMVKKVYETPIGANVDMGNFQFRDAKGKNIKVGVSSFVNPQFTTIKHLSDTALKGVSVELCRPWGKGNCDGFNDIPEVKRLRFDLMGWAARTELPNITEADLAAAAAVAVTIPNTSPKNVVQAVEAIINRNVVRGETTALLTPSAQPGAPPGAALTPIIPADIIRQTLPTLPPSSSAVPPSSSAPVPPSSSAPAPLPGSGVTPDLTSPTPLTPDMTVPDRALPSVPGQRPPVTAGMGAVPPWVWVMAAAAFGLAVIPRGQNEKSRLKL